QPLAWQPYRNLHSTPVPLLRGRPSRPSTRRPGRPRTSTWRRGILAELAAALHIAITVIQPGDCGFSRVQPMIVFAVRPLTALNQPQHIATQGTAAAIKRRWIILARTLDLLPPYGNVCTVVA